MTIDKVPDCTGVMRFTRLKDGKVVDNQEEELEDEEELARKFDNM